ncbi:hypothetical protein V1282_001500 [Nitrobacteraceae bacterium AZCC 2146]
MQKQPADLRSTKDARKIAQRTITVRTVKRSGQARNNPMSAARSLLEGGHLTLKQVAAFCGFVDANISGASSCATPAEYRKRYVAVDSRWTPSDTRFVSSPGLTLSV